MKLVDLIPLKEIDFPNQKTFDAYNQKHQLRPDTKVTVAGKTTTAGKAAQKYAPVKGTSVFGGKKEKSITDIKPDAKVDVSKVAKTLSANIRLTMSPAGEDKNATELKKRLDKGQKGVYTRTSPYGGEVKFEDGTTFDVYRPHTFKKTNATTIYVSKQ